MSPLTLQELTFRCDQFLVAQNLSNLFLNVSTSFALITESSKLFHIGLFTTPTAMEYFLKSQWHLELTNFRLSLWSSSSKLMLSQYLSVKILLSSIMRINVLINVEFWLGTSTNHNSHCLKKCKKALIIVSDMRLNPNIGNFNLWSPSLYLMCFNVIAHLVTFFKSLIDHILYESKASSDRFS